MELKLINTDTYKDSNYKKMKKALKQLEKSKISDPKKVKERLQKYYDER